jgi:hypothetical protein
MGDKPRILIGTVTNQVKDYCWAAFKKQLLEFKKLGHDVLIVDNTHKIINRPPFKTIHYNPKPIYSKLAGTGRNPLTVITRDCMNILRDEFLKGDYTHLFVLESDVFIEIERLQKLVDMKADVANYTYPMRLSRNNGLISLCVQSRGTDNASIMLSPQDSKDLVESGLKVLNVDTINGRTISHCGYGCTLISRKVLEKIEFQAVITPDGKQPFPDSMFHEDVKSNNFYSVLDTDYLAFHANLHDETVKYKRVLDIQSKTTRRQRRASKRRN